MKISEAILSKCKSVEKTSVEEKTHQSCLAFFAEYLEDSGVPISLPNDNSAWWNGADLVVNGTLNIDVKGFSLIPGPITYTWDWVSETGARRSVVPHPLIDLYVHPYGKVPAEWLVAPSHSLTTSFHNDTPFYWKRDCMAAADFVKLTLKGTID